MFVYDLDQTLTANDAAHIEPHVIARLKRDNPEKIVRICTNQGAPTLKKLAGYKGLPDTAAIVRRFDALTDLFLAHDLTPDWYIAVGPTEKTLAAFGAEACTRAALSVADEFIAAMYFQVYIEDHYRKPNPGMLYLVAVHYAGQVDSDERCVYVGDQETDRVAAEAANVSFVWAKDYWAETTIL